MATTQYLTDEQWEKIQPLLPPENPGPKGGRPLASNPL
jgi:transposase